MIGAPRADRSSRADRVLERNQAIVDSSRRGTDERDHILFVDLCRCARRHRPVNELSLRERRKITALIGPNGAARHRVQLHHRLLQTDPAACG